MYLLDTDHLGIIQRESEPEFSTLMNRLRRVAPSDLFVSIVSFHEEVSGWNTYLHRARSTEAVVRAYAMFEQILLDFSRMAVVSFTKAAARKFDELRAERVRIGTMDLRIAATALSLGYTVLTRNTVDFTRVPGLRVEDWTK